MEVTSLLVLRRKWKSKEDMQKIQGSLSVYLRKFESIAKAKAVDILEC